MASPTTASNGKGHLSFGGWRPTTADDLLDTFSKMGRQLSTERAHIVELSQYLDIEREVDPKVVAKVEALMRVFELASDGCKDIAKTFEKLYADKLDQSKPKARTIVGESEFFGNG